MNKEQAELFTKIILCAILVLILCVLFHVLHSPNVMLNDDNYAPEKLKKDLVETQKVGEDLDKKFMDDYLQTLDTPEHAVQNDEPKKNTISIKLPKGFKVVDYKREKKK